MREIEIKDKLTLAETHEKKVSEPKKRAYSQPVLQVYGSVGKLTKSGAGTGSDGGATASMTMASDPKTKENIVRIGEHPLGIGLYLFDYKPEYRDLWGNNRQFGVMADEVEAVMPQAVTLHANGYKVVDYAMLGIYHTIQ